MTIEINPSHERMLAIFYSAIVGAIDKHPQPWSLTEESNVWFVKDAQGGQVCISTTREFAEKFIEAGEQFSANYPDAFMPPDPEYT